ncbi:MAG TPA: phytanoyl-CoA dioxygenase family protein [Acidimicrobiia bacterium]
MRLGRRGRSDPAAPRAASDEVASLTLQNKTTRDAEVEERLLRLRHEAYFDLHAAPLAVWPPVLSDPFPEVVGRPPELTPTELTAAVVGGAIQHHGCLLVRGLLSPERVARLVDDTDRAFRARDDALAGAPVSRTRPWYVPFEPGPDSPPLADGQRQWVRECGAVWAADSPAAMFDVMESFDDARIPQLVTEYLGEPAALSVNKCTLRRVRPGAVGAWHQDGSFLGSEVRTVSVWVALSECGDETSSPGLGMVPRRVDHVLPTNIAGTASSISVGLAGLTEALHGMRPLRPTFGAGDALLFDELFVHCTGGTPGVTQDRYALESWFFAPSTFPETYVPMAV